MEVCKHFPGKIMHKYQDRMYFLLRWECTNTKCTVKLGYMTMVGYFPDSDPLPWVEGLDVSSRDLMFNRPSIKGGWGGCLTLSISCWLNRTSQSFLFFFFLFLSHFSITLLSLPVVSFTSPDEGHNSPSLLPFLSIQSHNGSYDWTGEMWGRDTVTLPTLAL